MMEKKNNYLLQAQQARDAFLSYDQQKLVEKFSMSADDTYLYTTFVSEPCRIHRKTGEIQRLSGGSWQDDNSFDETMTLLDLLCDSREDRFLSGRWKNMQAFGLQFHKNLLEDARSPFAEAIQQNPEGFCRGCESLGGVPLGMGDIAYAVELFDGLRVGICFWAADEDFPASIRWYWDENANMYIRYETMYFAIGLLMDRISEYMQ